MAADWAYNSDALFLYHQAGVAVDTVDRLKFAELLYYDKGCMFARHVDRQVAPNHVGTLLCVFNSDDLDGGELHLEQQDGSGFVTASDPGGCFMVFIPLGMPHWVTKVLHGHRLVAKCPVLGSAMLAPVPRDDPPPPATFERAVEARRRGKGNDLKPMYKD
jgi:hypothetical protein